MSCCMSVKRCRQQRARSGESGATYHFVHEEKGIVSGPRAVGTQDNIIMSSKLPLVART
jgi:hypothetical protein